MMKIALPTAGKQVDSHFGHCQFFTIFTVDDHNRIVSSERFDPPPGCGCKSKVVPLLVERGVSVMLAGNMGGGAVNVLAGHGIKVVRGCAGELVAVVEAWLAGKTADSGIGCGHPDHEGCHNH